jgi:hypothetical protein
MMRSKALLACLMAGAMSLGLMACSDDDSTGNNNNADLCGNGVVDNGEDCDGAELGGETCVTQGLDSGDLACTDACTFDLSTCLGCGNGQIEVGEVCDGTNLDGQTCTDVGNFTGGTLACNATCDDYNTSGCDEPTEVCPTDESFSLTHGQAIVLHVNTQMENDTAELSCEEGTNANDRVYRFTVDADGDLVVNYGGDWLIFAVYPEPASINDCFNQGDEYGCYDAFYDGPTGEFSGLTAGTYYLVVSDTDEGQSEESDFFVTFYPAGAEICNNGVDDDGDGDIDCDDADCAAVAFCMDEICGNGVDDDLNGFTDCADMACVGTPACTGGGCTADTDLGTLSSVTPATANFDTTGGSDSYDLACGVAGANDHVIAFTLNATALVNVEFTQAGDQDNVIGFYFEGGAGSTCVDYEAFCFNPGATSVGGLLTTDPLPPATYYFIVEAATVGGGGVGSAVFTTQLICPAQQHDEGGVCVWDTCADMDCAAQHMGCNDTPTPSECEGCLAGYVPAYGRCYVAGTTYGATCLADGDCPGTGLAGTEAFCSGGPGLGGPSTGGMCYSVNTPECTANGQPCSDDADSRCVVSTGTGNAYCFHACAADTDCRPGYFCMADIFGSGQMACMPIPDCSTSGCNDPGSTLYCDAGGSDMCWVDACNPTNPCLSEANSTGVCANDLDSFICECNAGYLWNSTAADCQLCDDTTTDLGTFAGAAIQATGDSCTGTSAYSPAGTTCTGWDAAGQELVYRLIVNNGDTINVTMTPISGNGQDSSLYLLSSCTDFDANTCLAGADATFGGEAETASYTNSTGAALTVYIVADAFSGCGDIQLDIN